MPKGREVFKRAVTEMAAACRELLEKSEHTPADVDVLDPPPGERPDHDRGRRAPRDPRRALRARRGRGRQHQRRLDPDRARRAWNAGRIKEGDLVLFTSFGAGLTWGATPRPMDDAGAGA